MSKATDKLRKDVQAQIDRLAAVRQNLDQTDFLKEILPWVKKLVGATYVYRKNCYSMSTKPSDYWDVFYKIRAVVPKPEICGAYLIIEEIHIDSHGVPVWCMRSEWVHSTKRIPTGFVPCKASEYTREMVRIRRELSQPSKMKRVLLAEN